MGPNRPSEICSNPEHGHVAHDISAFCRSSEEKDEDFYETTFALLPAKLCDFAGRW